MLPRSLAVSALLLAAGAAHGEPTDDAVALVPPTALEPAATTTPGPGPDELANAPAADEASGIAVPRPYHDHWIANTLLAIPRTIVLVVLTGPRYGASRLDDYLEARSPNAFGRDVHQSWRFGFTADWETVLGPSVGLRLGRELGETAVVDVYGGLFGARGQSGGLRIATGPFTGVNLEPALTFDAGRSLDRVFAGVGDGQGPRVGYEERRITVGATLPATVGALRAAVSGRYEDTTTDDGDTAFAAAYDTSMLAGIDERDRAGTGEVSVAFDARKRRFRWIRPASPSSGFYARGAFAYTKGEASRTGTYTTARGTLEARQLFDLFNGDRVLSIGVFGEAISAKADAVPFERLPALGGMARLRAFARDEFRDRSSSYADVMYEWALGDDSRGYLFVEGGSVQPRPTDLALSRMHLGYGIGMRYLKGAATSARFQIAGSDDGDIGFYLQLGAL
ncbi:hypothetical protein BH11MYX3_BH11MYX3_03010 [soil metagenome]